MALAALVIDGKGRVVAMTAAAERIVEAGEFLAVRCGRLEGIMLYDTQKIDDAIKRFTTEGNPDRPQAFVLTGARGTIANIQLSPLSRADDIGGNAGVIVEIEPLDVPAKLFELLTAAETDVAAALLGGARATEIACQRNVSIETVRSQIKSIYAKFDVRGHVELIAALGREPIPG